MSNPYSWNSVNPDLFFGRERLLGEMLSNLPGTPRNSFGLAGGRRMGKSTLLRRVEKELKAGVEQWKASGFFVMPVYIDGLTFPHQLTDDVVWAILIRELRPFLPQLPLVKAMDFYVFKETLAPVLQHLAQTPRVIFLFDEIEAITSAPWGNNFLDNLRALLNNTPNLSDYFTCVIAGAHNLEALKREVTSPMRGVLEWRSLRLLDYEDSCRLMQEPINHMWPESFLTHAFDQTGGHPMLLQYLMQNVCRGAIEQADTTLDLAVRTFGKDHRWQFAQWWNHYCMPPQPTDRRSPEDSPASSSAKLTTSTTQHVYACLPDNGDPISLADLVEQYGDDEAHNALEILQHVGIAVELDDGFAFRYAGEMFRDWYRRYGKSTESPQHDAELYGRLTAVQPAIAGKYLSAWKDYQQPKPDYSGVLAQLRGVLELLLDEFAPVDAVSVAPGFTFDKDKKVPTLRQRVRFMALKQYGDKDRAREIYQDYNLLDNLSDQIAQVATNAARTASGSVHSYATRKQAYMALKQWDSILLQLLPVE